MTLSTYLHIIPRQLKSSSYNLNKHEQEYITSYTNQETYPWTPIKLKSVITNQSPITSLIQVTQQELWLISYFTYHSI